MKVYDFYVTPKEYVEAAKIGVDDQTLDRRIRLLGWEKKRAITTPIRPLNKDRAYWRKKAEVNGISFDAFHSRIRRGWTDEKAATKPLQTKEECRQQALKATEKNRKIPRKYMELAEKNNIPYSTLYSRIRKGWSFEKAASQPKMTRVEIGRLGAAALRKREGDWAVLLFGKR